MSSNEANEVLSAGTRLASVAEMRAKIAEYFDAAQLRDVRLVNRS
jgi:hypothetical protein